MNGYSPYLPWSHSIGLKPHLIRYAERNQRTLLAEDYLINSYYTRHDVETDLSINHFYGDASLVTQSFNQRRHDDHLQIISLPSGVPLEMRAGEAMLRRRSESQYTGDEIEIDYLATIARCARGVSRTACVKLEEGSEINLNFCTVASAGHLYPVDIYFLVLNVKGLEQGIYQYIEQKDHLVKIRDKKSAFEILDTFIVGKQSILFTRCNYICLFAAHPWKTMSKYGNRGLRFVLHEIGAISQNIHLANVCLGLGSLDWGGYYENEVNQVMDFDGVNQSILHMVLAGITN